jgi:prolyl-tRNA synthetase
MRQSQAFLYTLHDPPSDADAPSHRLLGQAGFIHKLSAGIYSYTPSMWRVLRKISEIVCQEMDNAGAQEVMLPILQPRSIWDLSGRWDTYVQDRILFHFKDRKNAEVCLGPTHEEVVTTLVDNYVSSYKQLPINLYQIQTKFRDEIRPRFGLMRGREFIMKDAYSFDIDEAGMNSSYQKMADAYSKIFKRCGLEFSIVDADAGAIGGSGSQEFIVKAQTGEDVFLICDELSYSANQERAVSEIEEYSGIGEKQNKMQKVETPGMTTVSELTSFFKNTSPDRFLKTLLYKAIYSDREERVVALIRGDREVNEVKLKNELHAIAVLLATETEIEETFGTKVGYIGPVGLRKDVRIIADESVRSMCNFITGANEEGFHYTSVNLGRDFKEPEYKDIRLAVGGDLAIVSKEKAGNHSKAKRVLTETRGIEVGHIFKLGTKYSEAMKTGFTSADGSHLPFVMGCYGIGISRIAAAAIEQSHDERGMIWPIQIAPWAVHLVCVNPKQQEQKSLSDLLYKELTESKIEVLYDDRVVSAGIKFNDADLIGLPIRITVGRDSVKGEVEFLERARLSEVKKIKATEVRAQVERLLV